RHTRFSRDWSSDVCSSDLPCAPEFGWNDIFAKPVMADNQSFNSLINCIYPVVWSAGANGCKPPKCAQVNGSISVVAFNFMVHEPKGIIEWHSDKSLASKDLI